MAHYICIEGEIERTRAREGERKREERKDIVADKEFEIFDDTYIHGSPGNEGGNTGDVGIHRRSIPSRK